MSADNAPTTPAHWANHLLSLDDAQDREDLLRSAGLFDGDGLSQLLDTARQLIAEDPARAIELAAVVRAAAGTAGAPDIEPQADLLTAQAHAECGRMNTAWTLLESARDGFERCGDAIGALRTKLGLMHVLTEVGRPDEALSVGESILDATHGPGAANLDLSPERVKSFAAGAHVNGGVCLEMTGRFEEALDAFAKGEGLYRELDVPDAVADTHMNRGVVLLGLGRGSDALAAFRSAAEIYDAERAPVPLAKAVLNIGCAHTLVGDFGSALEAFEGAHQILEPRGMLSDSPILLVDRADALLALNLVPEALDAYGDAERILHSTGASHHRARALWGLGIALVAQSKLEQAENALILAGSLFDASSNHPLLAGVMLEHAALIDASGDRQRARSLARGALDRVSGQQWPVQQVLAHLRMADLALPNTTDAEMHLVEAERVADRLEVPQLTFRLNQRFGHVRRLQGREEDARLHLEAAVDEVDRVRSTLAQEALRQSFLHDKYDLYEDLTEIYLDRGDADSLRRAFELTEGAKNHRLSDMLSGQVASRLGQTADPQLAARLMRLQADLNAVYGELLGDGRSGTRRSTLERLESRAADLEHQIDTLRDLIGAQADEAATEAAGRVAPSDDILLTYHVVGDEIVAFVGQPGSAQAVVKVGQAPTIARLVGRLDAQWARVRARPDFVDRHMDQLTTSVERALESLYTELLAPVEPALAAGNQVGKVTIIPHKFLHRVPFHALFDGRQHMLDRFEIAYAPSATVWSECQQRTPRSTGQTLVLATAAMESAMASAQSLAHHMAGASVHMGSEATTAALWEGAADSEAIHLACRGSCRSDNPMFSSLELTDGPLTANEIAEMDLGGAMVTFGGQESGEYVPNEGDEILGLANAVLGAGASSMVASQWPADEGAAALVMNRFYESHSQGLGRAAALRAAQLSVKEMKPHPFFWAPFVLFGKR